MRGIMKHVSLLRYGGCLSDQPLILYETYVYHNIFCDQLTEQYMLSMHKFRKDHKTKGVTLSNTYFSL